VDDVTTRRVARALAAAGAAAVLLAAGGCRERGPTREEGERAVRAYTARLVEAYRASDEAIVDPLVGEAQGRRLLGLIGVKRDMGLSLDAELLELTVDRVEGDARGMVVETSERWHYRDRQIGSGTQVGQESTDAYRIRYRFQRARGAWVLEELEFAGPPVVGRTEVPGTMDARTAHGMPTAEEAAAAAPAAGPDGHRRGGPPPGHPPMPPLPEPGR
jgi:hypothetical protein